MKPPSKILPLLLLAANLNAAAIADKIGADALAIARTTDLSKFKGGVGLRVSYDLSERLGLAIDAEGSDTADTIVESVGAGLKFSLPVKALGPVRPYLIGGGGVKVPKVEEFVSGGCGLEYRWKALRVFGEARAEKALKTRTSGVFLGGLGFRF